MTPARWNVQHHENHAAAAAARRRLWRRASDEQIRQTLAELAEQKTAQAPR